MWSSLREPPVSDAKDLRTAINTRLKGDYIQIAADVAQAPKVATGLLSFDEQTQGGLPMGVPISIQGRKSVGKSAFCYYMAGRSIKQYGGVPFVIQTEPGFDPIWAEQCGLPAKGCIFYEGTTLASSLQLILDILEKDKPTCVILDSLSMLSANPNAKLVDSKSRGDRAIPTNWFFRNLMDKLDHEHPPLFMYIEHLHPVMDRPGLQVTGGETKGYANGMEIRLQLDGYKVEEFTSYAPSKDKTHTDELPVQANVAWEIRKSKSCPVRGKGLYELGLRETLFCKPGEITDYSELLVRGVLNGHIKKAGSWISIISTGEKYQGDDKFRAAVDTNTLRKIVTGPRPTEGTGDSEGTGGKAKASKRGGNPEGRLRGKRRNSGVAGGTQDDGQAESQPEGGVAAEDTAGSDAIG